MLENDRSVVKFGELSAEAVIEHPSCDGQKYGGKQTFKYLGRIVGRPLVTHGPILREGYK